jgi:hypothetical protein
LLIVGEGPDGLVEMPKQRLWSEAEQWCITGHFDLGEHAKIFEDGISRFWINSSRRLDPVELLELSNGFLLGLVTLRKTKISKQPGSVRIDLQLEEGAEATISS